MKSNWRQRILSLVLCVCMAVGSLYVPTAASAQGDLIIGSSSTIGTIGTTGTTGTMGSSGSSGSGSSGSTSDKCANGHTFGDWTTVKDATCVADGERKHTCSVCGETVSEVIFAKGHNIGTDDKCTVCGKGTSDWDECPHDSGWSVNGFCLNCGLGYEEPTKNGDVYEISNAGKLYWFANHVNSGNTTANAKLTADITVNKDVLTKDGSLNGTPSRIWTPIGSSSKPYTGTFDGQSYSISGLYFNDDTVSNVGLFGYIGKNGTVQNVTVKDSYLRGNQYVGGVVGNLFIGGTVKNCTSAGAVSGANMIGGMVGYNNGTITNCHNSGTVSGANMIGGIVGNNTSGAKTTNCYNCGAVSGTGYSVGGVVGNSGGGSIANCYNSGAVSGTYSVGGVVGSNNITIENCFYLSGCATDGNGTQQNGIGNMTQGESTADTDGATTGKTAAQFASGEVAYLLNGDQSSIVWHQTIGTDDFPNLTGKDTVYCYTACNNAQLYANTAYASGTHVAFNANGFCAGCDAYQEPTKNGDVYEIDNAGKLYWFAQKVNGGSTDINGKLTANITVNKGVLSTDGTLNTSGTFRAWTPIGGESNRYTGAFDGNGKTISGLYVDGSAEFIGLFGYVDAGGTVKNVTVKDSYIEGGQRIGGVAGYNAGTVTNCHSSCTLSGSPSYADPRYIGGVVGTNDSSGTIENCSNSGTVAGTFYVGGVVGTNYGTIANCYNVGVVTGTSGDGGVVGSNDGTVDNCYYLADTRDDTTGAMTEADFASGEVAYKLNAGADPAVWYQNGTLPGLSGDAVTYDETNDTYTIVHTYSNGFCVYGCSDYQPCKGSGTESDPYLIGNAGQLYWFADKVNGIDITNYETFYAKLTADVVVNPGTFDANGNYTAKDGEALRTWTPIVSHANAIMKGFIGTFDGAGHSISGLYYKENLSTTYSGLFRAIGNSATVKNVTVQNSYFSAAFAGAIAGQNKGTVENCRNVNCTVSCYGDSIVSSSGATGSWSPQKSTVGGIVGKNVGTVTGCTSSGTVKGCGTAGGIVGENTATGKVEYCRNDGNVSEAKASGLSLGRPVTTYLGGIVGNNSGTVNSCYATKGNNVVANGTAATNSFYLANERNDETGAMTAADFASGEVAYKLNGSQNAGFWKQTLEGESKQALPAFTGGEVYYGYLSCADDAKAVYTNKSSAVAEKPKHNYVNGICEATAGETHYEPCQYGDGTAGYAYRIWNAGNLYWFAQQVNNGRTDICALLNNGDITINAGTFDRDGNYTPGGDEDTKPRAWIPIGTAEHPFIGTFDGGGNTILGLYFDNASENNVGLFGVVGDKQDETSLPGTIKNVTVENVWLRGGARVGGIAGKIVSGSVENCNVKNADLFGREGCVGGIVGDNYGTVKNCTVTAGVRGLEEAIGGIAGENETTGTVENCTVKDCGVTGSANGIGGIVGSNTGTIKNCTVDTVTVAGTGDEADKRKEIGGVVGSNYGKVSDCTASGTVTGDAHVGGIVGYNQYYGTVSRCVASQTSVTAYGIFDELSGRTDAYVGGVVGYNVGTIEDCYAVVGTIASANDETPVAYVGGVVGQNKFGTVKNCFSYCDKIGGINDYVGGVFGKNDQGTVDNCYYLAFGTPIWEGGMTRDEFKSGKVAYLLNGSTSDGELVWYQYLNEDNGHKYPCLVKDPAQIVYCGYESYDCDESHGVIYTNNSGNIVDTKPEHNTNNVRYESNGDGTHKVICYTCGKTLEEAENCVLGSDGSCTKYGCDYHCSHDNVTNGFCDDCGASTDVPTLNDNGYYEIRTVGQLYWFAQQVNGGNTGICGKLMNNITVNQSVVVDGKLVADTSGLRKWEPIANGYASYYNTFDGQGFTISGLYCVSEGYAGFFGYMGPFTVSGLNIENSYFKGSNAGAIAAYSESATFEKCSVGKNVIVIGSVKAGGIVGNGEATIRNCFALANIEAPAWGGFTGDSGTISNSFTTAMQPVGGRYCTMTNVFYGKDTRDYVTPDEAGYLPQKPTFEGATEVLDEKDFTSGKIAWLLNGMTSAGELVWKQTLDGTSYPGFSGGTVYQKTNVGCKGSKEEQFSNTANETFVAPHAYTNGFCTNDGCVDIYEPAKLVNNVYEISNAGQLYWFAGLVNGTLTGVEQNASANGKLMANITVNPGTFDADGNYTKKGDETLRTWTPIGSGTKDDVEIGTFVYIGTFDGNGHTISGLYFNNPQKDYVGLFGSVGENGTVQKVGVVDSYLLGNFDVGGIAGFNAGKIDHCYNAGTVSGFCDVGGVAGFNIGKVTNCCNQADISGGDSAIGGVVGFSRGEVTDCYNAGTVSGFSDVGGVVGCNHAYESHVGTVQNCYNTGIVTGTCSCVGGIVGQNNDSTVTNCYYLTGTASIGIGNTTADNSQMTDPRTEDAFTSGNVTWLLNGSGRTVWKQTLNGTNYPSFEGEIVYRYKNCKGEPKFANTKTADNSHSYVNGFCTACDAYQPAVKNGDVYEIYNAGQLYWFAGLVNGTLTDVEQNASANGKLMANITVNPGTFDADGKYTAKNGESVRAWTPIGNNEPATNIYVGDFDGDGHTISGLYFNEVQNYVGLFGVVSSGTIQDLTVKDSYFNGGQYIGAVVGSNDSNLKNCHNDNTFVVSTPYFVENANGLYKHEEKTGYWYGGSVGGVAGQNDSRMNNCTSSGKVIGKTCDATYSDGTPCSYQVGGEEVGGVVGCNWDEITDCYNTGTVIGDVYVGGVVGWNIGTVKNCYNTGAVSGDSGVGGVVGWNISTVTNCYNQADISGDACVGGVVGINGHPQAPTGYRGTVENCYNTGNVSDSQNNAGGIGTNYCIGSVVGCNVSGSTVTNCYYKTGTVSAGIGGDSTNNAVEDATGETEAMEEADFLSGKVTWLLNGKKSDGVWKQTINNQSYPNFTDEDKVYYGYTSCANNAEKEYTNNEKASAEKPHTFDANGFCDRCAGETHYQAPKGDGAADSPYEIANAGQLYWFAAEVNSGKTTICAKLVANITVNENVLNTDGSLKGKPARVWTPIGTDGNEYTGTFDGGIYDTDGKLTGTYTISGLYFDDSTKGYVGLFGYIGGLDDNRVIKATVKNVTVKDSYFSGKDYVGAIVGRNYNSNVENCHNFATVKGTQDSIGGIVGFSSGTVSDCTNSGMVSGGYDVGGIVGKCSDGNITGCTNGGNVSGGYDVGGVIGYNSNGKVKDCGNTSNAKVTGSSRYVGGVCGQNNGGTLENVYNAGTVSGGDQYVGGVCGYNAYELKNVYNTGAVTGTNYVGGVVGYNAEYTTSVTNGFNTGTVTGTGDYVGGIAGVKNNGTTITNCYYLLGTASTGIGGKTDAEGVTEAMEDADFKSGKVTYLLNGEKAGNNVVWKQTLTGTDADQYPNFASENIVYYGYLNCKDGKVYTNDASASDTITHVSYTNGFCDACGAYEKPTGSGTADDPYQIDNAGKLYWFAGLVNGTLTDGTPQNTGAHAILTDNIVVNKDLLDDFGNVPGDKIETVRSWSPIGRGDLTYDKSFLRWETAIKFTGSFDGRGYTVSGLYFNNVDTAFIGLFGYVDKNGSVKNVGVVDSYFGGNQYVGGVAGRNDGNITGCYSGCTVVATAHDSFVGGVVGSNYGTVENCYNTGTVTGTNVIGGVAGENCASNYDPGTMRNCYNVGAVNYTDATLAVNVGGVVGANRSGTVTNCYYQTGTASTGIGYDGGTSTNVEAMTATDFTSGKVTWLLNGKTSTGVWKQTLNGTEYPNFTSESIVYGYYENCTKVNFTNTKDQDGSESPKAHNYVDNNGFCTVCDAYQPCEGAGTAESPYLITNAGNLYWFAAYVNQGGDNAKACAKLVDDITVNSEVFINGTLKNALASDFRVWTPMGNRNNQYTGTFDGNGKYISGLYFDNSSTEYVGLFGYVGGKGGTVKNVTVKDSYFCGYTFVGGIAGANIGTVSNCSFAGKVEGENSNVGGIVGQNKDAGKVENCHNDGTVTGFLYVGGVVGSNEGTTVTGCYNTGSVIGSGEYSKYIGGVTGYNNDSSTVANCYNIGTVTGAQKVGGVVGVNYGKVENCYNTGAVTGTNYVGGVVGCNGSISTEGTVTNCYYLSGCATDGDGTEQYGVGNETQGKKTTDVLSWTAGYDLDTFKSGMIAYLLNGSKSDETVVWKQTVGTHGTPGFTGSIVYTYKDCQTIDRYTNDKDAKTGDCYFDTNGFCACGAFQPAVLNGGVYEIYNAGQLYWFAQEVNKNGETSISGKLMKDITVNKNVLNADGTLNTSGTFRVWTPIGSITDTYKGTFDGTKYDEEGNIIGSYSISGLYFNDAEQDCVGLFGYVQNATLQNIRIADSYFCGKTYVGGIVGYAEAKNGDLTIRNCTNAGHVCAKKWYAGGVAGIISGAGNATLADCSNSGMVSGSNYVGGVAGRADAESTQISNCSNSGTVSGEDNIGGVIGYVNLYASNSACNITVTGCVNSGTVSGEDNIGGVIGSVSLDGQAGADATISIENCHNTNTVSGVGMNTGGVVGSADAYKGTLTIGNCYNTGNLTATVDSTSAYVGGVVGYSNASGGKLTVENCYNVGDLTATATGDYASAYVGGVVGYSNASGGKLTVENCYNVGDLTTTATGYYANAYAGGVVAYASAYEGYASAYEGTLTVENCYNTGDLTATATADSGNAYAYVGGVVGYASVYEGTLTVENCYNTGDLTATATADSGNAYVYAGGVVGYASVYEGTLTVENCYYLDTFASDPVGYQNGTVTVTKVESKTEAEFESGLVTWLLNGKTSDGDWRQTLTGTNPDKVPNFTGEKVYPMTRNGNSCSENTKDRFSNTEGQSFTAPHTYSEDGFCACGAYQPAVLNGGVYEIYNAGQLYWFAQEVNKNGETAIDGKLMKDITVNTGVLNTDGSLNTSGNFRAWTPIGSLTFDDENRLIASDGYTGTFDGAGHSISGLYANAGGNYVGLFGVVGTYNGSYDEYYEMFIEEGTAPGTVKNVTLKDTYVGGGDYVGGIAGYVLSGTVDNCKAENVTVIGTGGAIGGIAGENDGTVSNCTASGTVSGDHNVGGIAGWNNGNVTGCAAMQTGITATGGTGNVGGVVGYLNGGKIERCYAIVTAISGKNCVGGILGGSNDSKATVKNCYAVVTTLSGSGSGTCYVGGIAGAIGHNIHLENCYSYCTSISGICVGGVVGYGCNGNPYQNCYWLDTCGATSDVGYNNHNLENKAEAMTAADFLSGKVAYLLNGKSSGENVVWKQTLTGTDPDKYPNFASENIVYYGYKDCADEEAGYANTALKSEKPAHNYEGGSCTECGKDETISVTIQWTSMSFSYHKGTWNTETMTWEGGGWFADEGCGTVTVTNTSSVDVNAQFGVTFTDDSLGISVSFTENDALLEDKKLKVPAGEAKTVAVKLTGKEPSAYIETAKTIGQITVTLSTE